MLRDEAALLGCQSAAIITYQTLQWSPFKWINSAIDFDAQFDL